MKGLMDAWMNGWMDDGCNHQVTTRQQKKPGMMKRREPIQASMPLPLPVARVSIAPPPLPVARVSIAPPPRVSIAPPLLPLPGLFSVQPPLPWPACACV